MRAAQCDRARHWASLRLDGAISELESALLDRHLRACTDCRRFADDVTLQTEALRAAELEPMLAPVALPQRRHGRVGRVAVQGATAAAAVAAVALALVGNGNHATPPPTFSAAAANGGSTLAVAAAPRSSDNTLGVHRAPVVRKLVHGDLLAIRGEFGLAT